MALQIIIRRVSGEELTITLQEDLVPDVGALKQQLNQLHGLAARFRQRLLFDGQCLEDTATLHPGMELEFVILAFIPSPCPDEVQDSWPLQAAILSAEWPLASVSLGSIGSFSRDSA